MKNYSYGIWTFSCLAAMLFLLQSPALCFSSTGKPEDKIGDISLGDLLNLEVSVATKTPMKPEQAPSSVTVISSDEIRNMGARDITDILRTVPGFDMTLSHFNGTREMNIRGMISSSHNYNVKIMIDGHSLSALWGSSQQLFNTIPIANIKQIEVIRGPGSALYGTGAFLGIVNIITQKGGQGSSELALETGSFNTIKPWGRLSYQKNELKLALYADYARTDGYKEKVESDAFGTRPKSAAPGNTTNESQSCAVYGDIQYKNIYLNAFFQNTELQIPVGIGNTLTDEDQAEFQYTFLELGYNHPLSDYGNLKIRAFYDYGEQNALVEIYPEETSAEIFGWTNGESIFGLPYAENSITGSEITADYEITKGIELVAGTSYEYYRQWNSKSYASANITGTPLEINGITYLPMKYLGGLIDISETANWIKNEDRTVWALYGQGIFDIRELFSLSKGVKNLSATLGLRYDHYDDFGHTLNPRLGLVYAPSEKLWFKALYGEAFRAPNFKELYAINNPARTGNPDLEPEEIKTIEGIIGYNFTNNFKSTLTFFSVNAENLIKAVDKVYKNTGKMKSQGIETELRWNFKPHRYAYVNATWQNVNDSTCAAIKSEGGQIYNQGKFKPGGIPRIYGNIGINYDISDKIFANLWINYAGQRDRSEEMMWDGENLVRIDNREPLKDRTLVNASINFKKFYKSIDLQLTCFNMLNADHREPDRSGNLENDLPLAGISFMGKISYIF